MGEVAISEVAISEAAISEAAIWEAAIREAEWVALHMAGPVARIWEVGDITKAEATTDLAWGCWVMITAIGLMTATTMATTGAFAFATFTRATAGNGAEPGCADVRSQSVFAARCRRCRHLRASISSMLG
jgi:hypothetical protein